MVPNIARAAAERLRAVGRAGLQSTLGAAALAAVLAGPVHGQPSRIPDPAVAVLPATGQIESYPADRDDDLAEPASVPDDGRIRAGAPLRYRDNEDGTITDLSTGLVWEKKCSRCDGLHAAGSKYRWSGDGSAETVWDWLGRINAEGERGFAGHSDWRVPNVTELVSIVDYGNLDPAVDRAFDGDPCDRGCADATAAGCSCIELGEYWTSTTFADFPAHAYAVSSSVGLVNDRVKTNPLFVRAVRGGR